MKNWYLSLMGALAVFTVHAQTGDIRGFLYNGENGDRISGGFVVALSNGRTGITDLDGYYSLAKMPVGAHTLMAWANDYDTVFVTVQVQANVNTRQDMYLNRQKSFDVVEINRARLVKTTRVGVTTIDAKEIKKIPTIGAEADIIQYLQVLPGVVFSGDQGGQLYIRGGSPVMNRVMLDGLTIYNPFHSIGLYSVFETDLIKTADVSSAGFGAEYGGRVSAVVDIKTRDGNHNRVTGKVGAGTFTSKFLLEGPLKKYVAGRSNSSFVVSFRNSYLKQSSRIFYQYANPDKLPYTFGDLFGKLSFNMANGGYAKLYAFHFSDNVAFPGTTSYNWSANGLGGKFLIVPEQAKTRIDGFFLYSNYRIAQAEADNSPRNSSIGGFNMGMNFTYNFRKDDFKWGIEINGFNTDFNFRNTNNRFVGQLESTTELNVFGNYKLIRKHWVANAGLRGQYYASLGNRSLEPRMQVRYSPVPWVGIKFATGMYSQNLLAANSDRDVVNLFYGFLSGPDNLPKTFDGEAVRTRLQKAQHLVGGFDWTFAKHHYINVEGFYKFFNQITNINRDKLFDDDEQNQDKPAQLRQDYIIERGNAYGGDFSYKYSYRHWYIWSVYSLTWVNRYDGIITYQPVFDRRHNVNLLLSYEFDKKNPTEISLRWNLGSGFPFTQTQGYYEKFDFQNGIGTNYTTGSGSLGVIYSGLNQGRLPYYHRLDFSAKRTWKLKNKREWNVVVSLTNVYNRANIFYYDRVNLTRVNQLPILPAAGFTYSF
ncbi:MAG: TonB-dependent receptor plug domain-containing protein [Bacteroidetes bacterium]|nr:TonB-dependent receptor plug domain-containing protein [Bacteroidota bacterium]